jgi:hypothetical protein
VYLFMNCPTRGWRMAWRRLAYILSPSSLFRLQSAVYVKTENAKNLKILRLFAMYFEEKPNTVEPLTGNC